MEYTFISGATGGIGKAFCISCAKRGYNLFITGRSKDKLQALKDELVKDYNIAVDFFPCDLSDSEDRAKMFSYIEKNARYFDRIINVAGVDTQKAFSLYTREKVLFQINVNSVATLDITHFLLKRRKKELEIITISSMSGVSPMPYFAIYSATKDMLTNFFTALHYELKKDGVKITSVLPAGVPTRPDIIEEIKSQGFFGKISCKSPEYIAEKSLNKVKKNKLIFVPGFVNKVLYCLMKIAPKKLVLRYIARRWKSHSKDAFI
ncbi:MAG: SDR family NAD(P)-dependent oxidoreductase [Clostridia bacterium]|nr:SDR family NAD(P)-dependent oxidoreductase [Clostridia bacterium]